MTTINIGIDASNLRRGGGRTHLISFLSMVSPSSDIDYYVFGSESTLSLLPDSNHIFKIHISFLDKSNLHRFIFQTLLLSRFLKLYKCDLLFSPGGMYLGSFRPFVTMSRNMLPFEELEYKSYGFSLFRLKLLFLRIFQSITFQNANGVIFLSDYAKNSIMNKVRNIKCSNVIPHGVDPGFFAIPRQISSTKISLIYVSTISNYKHHVEVVSAVNHLIKYENFDLSLTLVGHISNIEVYNKLCKIRDSSSDSSWLRILGSIPHESLHDLYHTSDIGIFASSCENLPNILLEMMASSLPIASSNFGPMPEILGDCGVYFNPYDTFDIISSLRRLILDKKLCYSLSSCVHSKSKHYTWDKSFSESNKFFLQHISLG